MARMPNAYRQVVLINIIYLGLGDQKITKKSLCK